MSTAKEYKASEDERDRLDTLTSKFVNELWQMAKDRAVIHNAHPLPIFLGFVPQAIEYTTNKVKKIMSEQSKGGY